MEIKISKAQEETARTQSQLSQIESSFAELRHKYEEMKHSLNSAVKVILSFTHDHNILRMNKSCKIKFRLIEKMFKYQNKELLK
jgi:hypothetical protein